MNDESKITVLLTDDQATAAGMALAREAARLRALRSGGEKARWRKYEAALLESTAAALGYRDTLVDLEGEEDE